MQRQPPRAISSLHHLPQHPKPHMGTEGVGVWSPPQEGQWWRGAPSSDGEHPVLVVCASPLPHSLYPNFPFLQGQQSSWIRPQPNGLIFLDPPERLGH